MTGTNVSTKRRRTVVYLDRNNALDVQYKPPNMSNCSPSTPNIVAHPLPH